MSRECEATDLLVRHRCRCADGKQIYGCDGIGPDTADRLYEHYPSLPALIATAPEGLLAIEGLGPERTEAICSIFGDGE